jgi:hypothetical protein
LECDIDACECHDNCFWKSFNYSFKRSFYPLTVPILFQKSWDSHAIEITILVESFNEIIVGYEKASDDQNYQETQKWSETADDYCKVWKSHTKAEIIHFHHFCKK